MAGSRLTVPPSADGTRIDRVLALLLAEPRARSQARFDRGEITVDGTRVGKSHRVRSGDTIVVAQAAPPAAAPVPPPVPVRYEDDDVAVIAKPADLVVHPGSGVTTGTLVDALRAMGMPLAPGDDPDRPGIVHRLDRGTSGLLVIAKTVRALHGLRAQFDARSVSRRYWALVDGVPETTEAVIDAPIARHPQDRSRFQTAKDGRPARSHYVVRAAYGQASHVEVRLATGRTHQVRVHMAALGHPVCGDRAYGASAQLAGALGLERPALHAEHLGFAHPVGGARIEVDEPLPDDLLAAVARLSESDLTL